MKLKTRIETLIKTAAACIGMIQLTGCAQVNPLEFAQSDFNSISSAISISPVNSTIGVGQTLQFKGLGGQAPYTYSVTGVGTISVNGLYRAPSSITDVSQTAVVYATDALGYVASTTLTVQQASGALGVSFSPNPAPINTAVTITPTGGEAPYTYTLVSGIGSLSGNTYTTGLVGETAIITVTDSLGRSTQLNIPVSGPINAIANIGMTVHGTHVVGGGGCSAGYSYLGSVADTGGGFIYGEQIFCAKATAPTSNIAVLSDIAVTSSGGSCANGYSSIGQIRDCSSNGACSGVRQVCVAYRWSQVPGKTVTNFYITPSSTRDLSGPSCAAGYTRIGTVANCGSGYCYGLQSFCAAIHQ